MGDDYSELDLRVIEKFSLYVDQFTEAVNIQDSPCPDDVSEILEATRDQLKEMPSDDLNTWSFRLIGYAMHLQKELNESTAKRDWCNEVMNHLVAYHYDHDLYVKYEVRRKMCAMAENDNFGTRVEKIHTYMNTRVTLLTDKIGDIRRQADTLNQLAKRKDFR
jgi:hypothetical protein